MTDTPATPPEAVAPAAAAPRPKGAGLSIAGMVLGIIAAVFGTIGFGVATSNTEASVGMLFFTAILGIIGLVLSGVALGDHRPGRGMAMAGLICSLSGIVLNAVGAFVF